MPTISLRLGIQGLSTTDALEFFGPTLQVGIRRHESDSTTETGGDSDILQMRYLALIDTGARDSGIDSTLAEELGLVHAEDVERRAVGILGVGFVDVYLAQISIPELGFSIAGRFPGVHLAEGGQPYRALIGRDILTNFAMVYDGREGYVTLSNA